MHLKVNHIGREVAQIPESRRALPALVTFAALLMGALFIVKMHSDINYDGDIYIEAARKFAAGMYREGLAIYALPVYPYLLFLMRQVVPDWLVAGRLISLLAITLTIVPLYLLTMDLFNRKAAFWACISFTLLPETLLHSNSVLRIPLFVLCFIWAIYFAEKAVQSKRSIHLISSALLTFSSTLFRFEGFIIFPAYFFFLIALAILRSEKRKDYGRMVLTWGVLFASIVATIYIIIKFGAGFINRYEYLPDLLRGFEYLEFFKNYHHIIALLQQMQGASFHGDVGQHFAETAKQLIALIYFLGMLQIFLSVILITNGIPLLLALFKARYNERHILHLFLITCLFMLIYGYFIWHDLLIKKYLYAPAVMLLPWIGFGIEQIFAFMQRMPYRTLVVVCVVMVIFAVPAVKFDKYFKNSDNLKSLVGSWIAAHENLRNLKIILSDPSIRFHANMETDFQFDTNMILYHDDDDKKTFSKIAHAALENKADVIVIYALVERRKEIVEFKGYKEIKEFNRRRKLVKIYASLNRLPSIENPGN